MRSARSRFVAVSCAGILLLAGIPAAASESPPWAVNAPRAEGYSIHLVSAEPAPGTPLLRGATVPFKVTVIYVPEIAPQGAIVRVFQDESNRVVTGDREQSTVAVDKGSGAVTLTDEIVVPSAANSRPSRPPCRDHTQGTGRGRQTMMRRAPHCADPTA